MSGATERNGRDLAFVLTAVFVDSLGYSIVMPVMPEYLSHLTGESISDSARYSGLIMASFAITQFLCGPIIGNLSDRFGRRPILLASMFGFSTNYFLMAFAPTLTWLFIGRGLAGIAGAIIAPANAFVADITAPQNRARVFGYVSAAFSAGFVCGPAIGGFVGVLGPRAPFFASALLALANALFGLFVLKESLAKERRRAFSFARANPLGALFSIHKHRGVLPIILAIFLLMNAVLVFPSTWSFFCELRFNWSTVTIGASLTFAGATMAFVQVGLMGRFIKTYGERRTAIIGITAAVVGFFAMAFALQEWMIFAIMLFTSIQGVGSPSLNAIASKQTSPQAQGELQGTIASVNSLGAIVAPVMFSYLLSWSTAPTREYPFAGSAFILAGMLGMTALLLVLTRLPNDHSA